uniref:Unannotated protein n=1 Tax=freshwater metagenome TaxID=449393 RepID=A0A6J5Z9H6_9ZZZZ
MFNCDTQRSIAGEAPIRRRRPTRTRQLIGRSGCEDADRTLGFKADAAVVLRGLQADRPFEEDRVAAIGVSGDDRINAARDGDRGARSERLRQPHLRARTDRDRRVAVTIGEGTTEVVPRRIEFIGDRTAGHQNAADIGVATSTDRDRAIDIVHERDCRGIDVDTHAGVVRAGRHGDGVRCFKRRADFHCGLVNGRGPAQDDHVLAVHGDRGGAAPTAGPNRRRLARHQLACGAGNNATGNLHRAVGRKHDSAARGAIAAARCRYAGGDARDEREARIIGTCVTRSNGDVTASLQDGLDINPFAGDDLDIRAAPSPGSTRDANRAAGQHIRIDEDVGARLDEDLAPGFRRPQSARGTERNAGAVRVIPAGRDRSATRGVAALDGDALGGVEVALNKHQPSGTKNNLRIRTGRAHIRPQDHRPLGVQVNCRVVGQHAHRTGHEQPVTLAVVGEVMRRHHGGELAEVARLIEDAVGRVEVQVRHGAISRVSAHSIPGSDRQAFACDDRTIEAHRLRADQADGGIGPRHARDLLTPHRRVGDAATDGATAGHRQDVAGRFQRDRGVSPTRIDGSAAIHDDRATRLQHQRAIGAAEFHDAADFHRITDRNVEGRACRHGLKKTSCVDGQAEVPVSWALQRVHAGAGRHVYRQRGITLQPAADHRLFADLHHEGLRGSAGIRCSIRIVPVLGVHLEDTGRERQAVRRRLNIALDLYRIGQQPRRVAEGGEIGSRNIGSRGPNGRRHLRQGRILHVAEIHRPGSRGTPYNQRAEAGTDRCQIAGRQFHVVGTVGNSRKHLSTGQRLCRRADRVGLAGVHRSDGERIRAEQAACARVQIQIIRFEENVIARCDRIVCQQ